MEKKIYNYIVCLISLIIIFIFSNFYIFDNNMNLLHKIISFLLYGSCIVLPIFFPYRSGSTFKKSILYASITLLLLVVETILASSVLNVSTWIILSMFAWINSVLAIYLGRLIDRKIDYCSRRNCP